MPLIQNSPSTSRPRYTRMVFMIGFLIRHLPFDTMLAAEEDKRREIPTISSPSAIGLLAHEPFRIVPNSDREAFLWDLNPGSQKDLFAAIPGRDLTDALAIPARWFRCSLCWCQQKIYQY